MILNRIQIVLKEKRLTQQELADRLCISRTAVGDLCRNRAQPNLRRLFEIAAILECPPRELLVEDNPLLETTLDYPGDAE